MSKYSVGDQVIINIRGIEDHPSGILFYQIDPATDGMDRSISEETLEKILKMGGDLYASDGTLKKQYTISDIHSNHEDE